MKRLDSGLIEKLKLHNCGNQLVLDLLYHIEDLYKILDDNEIDIILYELKKLKL